MDKLKRLSDLLRDLDEEGVSPDSILVNKSGLHIFTDDSEDEDD